MNIQITARHATKISRETQDYLKSELKSLEKYHDKITSCHVILDSEHLDKKVEIILNVQGHSFNAKSKSENFGKSVDDALDKIVRQLKKSNEKLKNHKGVSTKEAPLLVEPSGI